jgi:hypothetical protein
MALDAHQQRHVDAMIADAEAVLALRADHPERLSYARSYGVDPRDLDLHLTQVIARAQAVTDSVKEGFDLATDLEQERQGDVRSG